LADVSVTFRLADGGAYTAVQGCTLDVADGEFVAIVGPTGCGKSTLLNVAAGLIAPSKGTRRSSARPLPASTGRPATVPGRGAVSLEDRGRERRDRAGDRRHRRRRRRARAREQWLTRVGLAGFGDRYPHMLSGGSASASACTRC
jgi:NitT/TauT family transport system ATP-binding protein